MPRKSSLNVPFVPSVVSRLKPPDDLTGDARSVFIDLVVACRADHFTDSDAPMLAIYCKAIVLEKAASAGLKAEGYLDAEGRPSGWLPILQAATRTISTYSRMLRLNPSARQASPPPSSDPERISGYEKFALEAQRDAN